VSEGVEEALLAEWSVSQPDLAARCEFAAGTASRAWRFVAEMEEIADTFIAAGLPDGAARAAADVYRRLAQYKDAPTGPELSEVVRTVLSGEAGPP